MPDKVNHDELNAWVLATATPAVTYAASLLRDRARAEDVVQDCYYKLWRKAAHYDLPNSGVKLLFRAITRACINLTTREPRVVSLDTFDQSKGRGWGLADATAQEPEQIVMDQELQQAVVAGLARLPVRHRAALELKSLGHSQREIAELLDLSPNHVGVLIHRARQALATHLRPFLREATL